MENSLLENTVKKVKFLPLGVTGALFVTLLYCPVIDNTEAQKAFALLVAVAILWITEAIPLALTGLMIPIMASILHLIPPGEAFHQFGHPIIFLFMGGFVIAGTL